MADSTVANLDQINEILETDLGYVVREGAPDQDFKFTFEQVLDFVENGLPPTLAPFYAGSALYVDPLHPDAVDDDNTGTPFVSIQGALDEAPGNSVIFVAGGTYSEDITIANNNMCIHALGSFMNTRTIIQGQVSVELAGHNFVMHGVEVYQPSTGTGDRCLVINNSGLHRFDRCLFRKNNAIASDAVLITGSGGGDILFKDCYFEGNFVNESSAGAPVEITGLRSLFCRLITKNAASILFIRQCSEIGALVHENGVLVVENCGMVQRDPNNDRALLSTAPNTAICAILNASVQGQDGIFGLIEIQNANFGLTGVVRDFENDILNGTRIQNGWNAQDFLAGYTPSQYSETLTAVDSLAAHLAAIDAKFAVVDGGEY